MSNWAKKLQKMIQHLTHSPMNRQQKNNNNKKTKQKVCKVHQKIPIKILFHCARSGPTIIVKSVGKAATFFLFCSFFPPTPGQILSKTSVFVSVIVLLYPNIVQGGQRIFSQKTKISFLRIKLDYLLYNLPINYFCLGL